MREREKEKEKKTSKFIFKAEVIRIFDIIEEKKIHEWDKFLLLLISVTHAQRGVHLYGENGREIYTDHPS